MTGKCRQLFNRKSTGGAEWAGRFEFNKFPHSSLELVTRCVGCGAPPVPPEWRPGMPIRIRPACDYCGRRR